MFFPGKRVQYPLILFCSMAQFLSLKWNQKPNFKNLQETLLTQCKKNRVSYILWLSPIPNGSNFRKGRLVWTHDSRYTACQGGEGKAEGLSMEEEACGSRLSCETNQETNHSAWKQGWTITHKDPSSANFPQQHIQPGTKDSNTWPVRDISIRS